jgi:type VI secretion system protein VasD
VFADSRSNPDALNRPTPVVVRVLLLRSDIAFNAADFFALYDREQATLGADLISRDEVLLQPGDSARLTKPLPPDARSIAALVAYRDLERATWRAVRTLPPAPPPTSPPVREALPVPVTLVIGERGARFAGS